MRMHFITWSMRRFPLCRERTTEYSYILSKNTLKACVEAIGIPYVIIGSYIGSISARIVDTDYNSTLLRTLRKNKAHIKLTKVRQSYHFSLILMKKLLLHRSLPIENKSIILISTMHNQKDINEITKNPEIIYFYNCTRGEGLDTFDKMLHVYI